MEGGRLAVGLVARAADDLGIAGQPRVEGGGAGTGSLDPSSARLRLVSFVRRPVLSASYSLISSTRRECRPPSKSVEKKVSTASMASAVPVVRPPRQTTLASLWRRAKPPWSRRGPERPVRPGTLLAEMLMPMPVPQTQSPRSARPSATARPTAMPKRDSRRAQSRSRCRGRRPRARHRPGAWPGPPSGRNRRGPSRRRCAWPECTEGGGHEGLAVRRRRSPAARRLRRSGGGRLDRTWAVVRRVVGSGTGTRHRRTAPTGAATSRRPAGRPGWRAPPGPPVRPAKTSRPGEAGLDDAEATRGDRHQADDHRPPRRSAG